MAELAAPTKLLFKLYIKKWQSRLSKNNCNTIYLKKMAELAAPTKLLYNLFLKNGRAGCANKTAIQYACLAHYFPLFFFFFFFEGFKFFCFLF
jgi:hypothetical protein